jgi:TLC domain
MDQATCTCSCVCDTKNSKAKKGKLKLYDIVIIVHHVLGVVGFAMSSYRIGTYYASVTLLAEISSIFLSIRAYYIQTSKTQLLSFQIVENAFVLLFFVVRIVYGNLYSAPVFISDLWGISFGLQKEIDKQKFPLYDGSTSIEKVQVFTRMALVGGLGYTVLNLFFFSQILKMAFKKR